VQRKKTSPKIVFHFLSNRLEIYRQISHACYVFIVQ